MRQAVKHEGARGCGRPGGTRRTGRGPPADPRPRRPHLACGCPPARAAPAVAVPGCDPSGWLSPCRRSPPSRRDDGRRLQRTAGRGAGGALRSPPAPPTPSLVGPDPACTGQTRADGTGAGGRQVQPAGERARGGGGGARPPARTSAPGLAPLAPLLRSPLPLLLLPLLLLLLPHLAFPLPLPLQLLQTVSGKKQMPSVLSPNRKFSFSPLGISA